MQRAGERAKSRIPPKASKTAQRAFIEGAMLREFWSKR
jgi:hypothetical protein